MAELRLADASGPVAVGKIWGKSLHGFSQRLEMQIQVWGYLIIVGGVWGKGLMQTSLGAPSSGYRWVTLTSLYL